MFLPNVSDANRFIVSLKWAGKVRDREAEHARDRRQRFPRDVCPPAQSVGADDPDVRRHGQVQAAHGRSGRTRSARRRLDREPDDSGVLSRLTGIFKNVYRQTPFRLKVSGAAFDVAVDGVPVTNVPWSLAEEVSLFNTCDIGVYPLTDDEWSKGKCGFKAIQFMACGVPVVASAVGENVAIIDDGVNGFLATTDAEWESKLLRLLTDAQLRARIAEAGRRTVEERYSLRVCAPRVAAVFDDAIASRS